MTVQACGRGDAEFEAGFEVGLIEAGEGHARVHGDEEGVEVFAAVVLIFKTRDGFAGGSDVRGEFGFDGVGAGVEVRGGEEEVAVGEGGGDRGAVEGEGGDLAVAEIEEEGFCWIG